jgi:hypothetical protein
MRMGGYRVPRRLARRLAREQRLISSGEREMRRREKALSKHRRDRLKHLRQLKAQMAARTAGAYAPPAA